jgi:uncharacterized protein
LLSKLFLIVGALLLALFFLRGSLQKRKQEREQDQIDHPDDPSRKPVRMVRCAHCGLHLPERESVRLNGQPFCSWEHAEAWKKKHTP